MVEAVKNYAAHYCAAKSLPWSAGVMALDCVSAAFSTVLGTTVVNPKSIAELQASGHKSEAKMLRNISYVCRAVDNGGGANNVSAKRKAKAKKPDPRRKRSRFRQHRTGVAKRVHHLASEILKEKKSFLENCTYPGLIIDEGNTFSRTCPIYAAIICCDPEFNFHIMFIGQSNCAGNKDGESIHMLTKKIFVDTGMFTIWAKLCSAGTDAASVMRSTHEFDGVYVYLYLSYHYHIKSMMYNQYALCLLHRPGL